MNLFLLSFALSLQHTTQINTMNAKMIKTFCIFLILVASIGAIIALFNRYLRLHDMTSAYSTMALSGVLIYVYYIAWRWLCRKLDESSKEK